MLAWILKLINLDTILLWLAQKSGQVGALSLLRFKQLSENNPGIVARFDKKQAEAAMTMPNASGADRLRWAVNSVLEETGEVGNDLVTALLYGFSTALFYEKIAPPITQQPTLPPVKVPIKEG